MSGRTRVAVRTARRLGVAAAVLMGVASLGVPAAAQAVGVEVVGGVLRVSLGPMPDGPTLAGNGVLIRPLPGGGAIVSLHANVNSGDATAGAGCQSVATSNAATMPAPHPGSGSATFAATCSLSGVRVVEGRLRSQSNPQGWFSSLNLPTKVTSTSNTPGFAGQGGDMITTGPAGDRITGGAENDVIDAGDAPFKGQEALPPSGNAALDDPNRNIIDGGGGNDTFTFAFAFGRDVVTGGAGVDLASYAGRFGVGAPGSAGVHVTLDGVANDGDPNFDPPDSAALGEGDNIGVDVENLTGTKREDRLIGSGAANTLLGDEGVDTLTAGAGEDLILAREPPTAGSGTADVISCGSPGPSKTATSSFGVFAIGGSPGNDRLQADLADPKPSSCELLVDMAVDERAPVGIARGARLDGRRLAVRLKCPRKAQRTCAGRLALAGRKRGSRRAAFSIAGGSKRTVRLKLAARVAKALRRPRAVARVVSNEVGLEGEVNRVELLRVR